MPLPRTPVTPPVSPPPVVTGAHPTTARRIAGVLAALLASAALAHTEVTAVTPSGPVPVRAPTHVTVTLSEPVSLRFATVRIAAVTAGQTPAQAAAAALAAPRGAPTLLGVDPPRRGMAAVVRVPLRRAPPAGTYVIAWRVLSDDGHPVTGHRTFTVK